MSAEEVVSLITALGGFVGVLVWPAVALLVAVRYRQPLSHFIENIGEFTLRTPGGLEATARRQVEAAVALGAAESQKAAGAEPDPERVADAVIQAMPSPRARRRTALWVDDNPDNNRYERQALEALGMRFTLSRSTEDALDRLDTASYDLIISDLGRSGDQRAGFTLLEALRSRGDNTPFVIYAGHPTPDQVKEARRLGATGYTASPQELLKLTTSAVTR
jgi:CheY-like chemotaxis protein